MATFNIISYLSGMTGFAFDKAILERIATERGVTEVFDYSQLDAKTKDLLLADLYYVIYTSPTSSASYSVAHGAFKESVGSQTINDRTNIYNIMVELYRKWGEEDKLVLLTNASSNGIEFVDATGVEPW